MTSLTLAKAEDIVIGIVILTLLALLAYKHLTSDVAGNKPPETGLGIDKLITQVKHDLEVVDEERIRENKAALFRVETFNLEVNFVVRRTDSAEAQMKYEVVTIGGKSDVSAEKVQKIILHFKAVDYSREETDIPGPGEFKPLKRSRDSPGTQ
jgi:hypothetical protein